MPVWHHHMGLMAIKKLAGRSLLVLALLFGLWVGGYHAYRAIAFEIYKQQARANDASGQYRLGLRYLERGSRADVERAIAQFKAALRNGHPKGRAGLGRAYRAMGLVVYKQAVREQDLKIAKIAADWFRRAASQGNANGMLHLASLHAKGEGVPKDLRKTVSLLRQSARLGNGWALYSLYTYQRLGQAGFSKDPVLAFMWLYLAAHRSDASRHAKKVFVEDPERERRKLSEAQVAKAMQMSHAWRRRYKRAGERGP